MKKKSSYISLCLMTHMAVIFIASPAFALQPWENGVFPLKEKIKKIDEALSFNFQDSLAEYQTEAEHLRLLKERDMLIHEREELAQQLEASQKIHDSAGVTYMAPGSERFNSPLHTYSPASR